MTRRPVRYIHVILAICMVSVGLLVSRSAQAVATSCDVKTGASCLWGEGCDCDHDGFVRSNGKAKKYCHFTKCPLDKNDGDASQLGKISTYNADGDGWTKGFDCDDKDPCVGKTCGVSTCIAKIDKDNDGVLAADDCDDNDPNVKPGAPIACCNCAILTDPAKKQAFGCAKGCPLSAPAPDTSSTPDTAKPDTTSTPDTNKADTNKADTNKADTNKADTNKVDTNNADTAGVTPPDTGASDGGQGGVDGNATRNGGDGGSGTASGGWWDVGSLDATAPVGGGTFSRHTPPAPGCSAAPVARFSGLLALFAGTLCVWILRRRRLAAAVAAALVVSSLSGCMMVKPWQREVLASRSMIIGNNSGEMQLEQHTFQYREGAAGGFGGGGGGCGCN